MYDYFTAVSRVPQWNPTAFSMRAEQSHFRYFKWYVDLNMKVQVDSLSAMLIKLNTRDRENQTNCRTYFERAKILPLIEQFCASRPQVAMQPDYVDLYYLYSHILETRPKVVLELGSGISTAVMAAALRHNGEGRLYSVDPTRKWAESTALSLPGELREWCEVTHSDAVPVKVAGRDSSRFMTLPVEHADMIYLDAAHKDAFFKGAETIHTMYAHFKGGETILIDSRWEAVEFFISKSKSYDVIAYANAIITDRFRGTPFALDLFANAIVTVRQPPNA